MTTPIPTMTGPTLSGGTIVVQSVAWSTPATAIASDAASVFQPFAARQVSDRSGSCSISLCSVEGAADFAAIADGENGAGDRKHRDPDAKRQRSGSDGAAAAPTAAVAAAPAAAAAAPFRAASSRARLARVAGPTIPSTTRS